MYLLLFRSITGDSIEDEDGDFRNKDDREHRVTSETDKNRVTWNIERRAYLDSSATKRWVSVCILDSKEKD